MPEGLYAAASGLAAQQARVDAISNDLANANTSGYHRERLAFRDLVSKDGVQAGAAAVDLGHSWQSGGLEKTDNHFALALDGPGFFQVRTADGRTALTRVGEFRVDAQRQLVLPGGEQLVPPVTVPASLADDQVKIGVDGTITGGGRTIGKIAVVDVPARDGLQAIGGGLYVATTASGAAAPIKTQSVNQGYIEGSNVDLTSAMTDLLDAQRSFDLASKAIKMQDQLMEIANGIRR